MSEVIGFPITGFERDMNSLRSKVKAARKHCLDNPEETFDRLSEIITAQHMLINDIRIAAHPLPEIESGVPEYRSIGSEAVAIVDAIRGVLRRRPLPKQRGNES